MDPVELIRSYQGTLTQGEYASKLGISQPYLSAIYSGQRRAGSSVLVALARAFPKSKKTVSQILFAPEYCNRIDSASAIEQESAVAS
jgi:transcriptional regulator with XRE-family HTH domain